MRSRIAKFIVALGVIATVGVTVASVDANARVRKCYPCTGGWCCY
jgi:hypothetical protein